MVKIAVYICISELLLLIHFFYLTFHILDDLWITLVVLPESSIAEHCITLYNRDNNKPLSLSKQCVLNSIVFILRVNTIHVHSKWNLKYESGTLAYIFNYTWAFLNLYFFGHEFQHKQNLKVALSHPHSGWRIED